MEASLENKMKELEDRIDHQEKIHHQIKPDGNYYHNVFFTGGTLLIGISVIISIAACLFVCRNK